MHEYPGDKGTPLRGSVLVISDLQQTRERSVIRSKDKIFEWGEEGGLEREQAGPDGATD